MAAFAATNGDTYAKARDRFLRETDGREAERERLRALAAIHGVENAEARFGDCRGPVGAWWSSSASSLLRALIENGCVDDQDMAERTIRLAALDLHANELVAEIGERYGAARATRALLLGVLVLARWESDGESRDLAERLVLRTLDMLTGRAATAEVDWESDIPSLREVGGVVQAARVVIGVPMDTMPVAQAGGWVIRAGAGGIEDEREARWAAACAIEAMSRCLTMTAASAPGDHADDPEGDLRRYRGVPSARDLDVPDAAE